MTPAGDAGTLSSLRALLDVAAVVRSRADLQHLFEEIGETVGRALGFLAVVVNVYRPAWDDYEVVVVTGEDSAPREILLGTHVNPTELAGLLEERFRVHDAFLVPHDQFDFTDTTMTFVPGTSGPPGPDAWHANDALLIPLTASDGRPLAFLSLDDPIDGRRPARSTLEIVSAVAAIAAGVIEHAQLAAEAARHRAAVGAPDPCHAAVGEVELVVRDEVGAVAAEALVEQAGELHRVDVLAEQRLARRGVVALDHHDLVVVPRRPVDVHDDGEEAERLRHGGGDLLEQVLQIGARAHDRGHVEQRPQTRERAGLTGRGHRWCSHLGTTHRQIPPIPLGSSPAWRTSRG